MPNDGLIDAFLHHDWATLELIDACRGLPDDASRSPAPGYGSIFDTFDHFVSSHASYLHSVGGEAATWIDAPASDLDEIAARVEESGVTWQRFLAEPFDAERTLLLDAGTYETAAGVVIAQALHHGNAHREQICAVLTSLGRQPPDVQPWEFALAAGRARWREP